MGEQRGPEAPEDSVNQQTQLVLLVVAEPQAADHPLVVHAHQQGAPAATVQEGAGVAPQVRLEGEVQVLVFGEVGVHSSRMIVRFVD